MHRAATLALGWLVVVGSCRAAEINALGGSYQEDVVGIRDEGGHLVLRTAQRSLPLEQVKSIRFQDLSAIAPDRQGSKVILTTGDWLRGTIGQASVQDTLTLQSRGLGELRLPLELVRAIIPETSPENERKLEALLVPGEETDWVRLKDGVVSRGTVGAIDGGAVNIEDNDLGQLSLRWDRVEMVSVSVVERPPETSGGLRVVARLADGSSLAGSLVALEKDKLSIRHPLGREGTFEIGLARVAELIVQNGAFVYLSDLDPLSVDQHFPPGFLYEVEVWGYKRDRSVEGGLLRLGGRTWDKGLGVHSYCALTYRLEGKFKELRAVVGLDDATRWLGQEPGLGAVVFRVLLDGQPAAEYPQGIVQRKGQPPTQVTVDVSGAQRLTLVADIDPVSLHVLGRADWADAHLIKKQP